MIIIVVVVITVFVVVISIIVVIIIAITNNGLLFVRLNALKHAPCWVGRPLLRKNAPEISVSLSLKSAGRRWLCRDKIEITDKATKRLK